jgi:hypothetical protein
MDKGIINGQMAESTKDSILTIGKTAMEFILTLTVAAIKACGRMANNMEKGFLLVLRAYPEKENGKVESASSGTTKIMNL